MAAPIFSSIGKQIVQYERARRPAQTLVVPKRTPNWPARRSEPVGSKRAMPDLIGLGLRNASRSCRVLGLKLKIKGKGRVVRQVPKAGAPIPGNRVCKVVLKEEG